MLSRSLHLRCDKCDGIEDAVEGGGRGEGGKGGRGMLHLMMRIQMKMLRTPRLRLRHLRRLQLIFRATCRSSSTRQVCFRPRRSQRRWHQPLQVSTAGGGEVFATSQANAHYLAEARVADGYVDGCYCRDAAACLFSRNTGASRRRGAVQKATFRCVIFITENQ
jgi:hypothetical protein